MRKANSPKLDSEPNEQGTVQQAVADTVIQRTHETLRLALEAYGTRLLDDLTARVEAELKTRSEALISQYVTAAQQRFKYELDDNTLKIEIDLN